MSNVRPMTPESRASLVSRWIERRTEALAWSHDLVLQRQDLHPETEDQLDSISEADPVLYWELLLEILHRNQSEDVLLHLSSRLLLLLETRPGRFTERVEAQAALDPQFKELLSWLVECPLVAPSGSVCEHPAYWVYG